MSWEFFLTALVVVIAPGTGVMYTVSVGLTQGRRATLAAATGCTLGIVPHLAAAISGLSALLHTSAVLFQSVKFAGAAFLIYLAWKTLRSGEGQGLVAAAVPYRPGRVAVRGILINLLNPKLSVFFLAFLPQFLSGDPGAAPREMLLLGLIFMGMTWVVFLLYGVFAGAARNRVLQSPSAMAWLKRSFAAIFAALGLKLATERL